MGIVRRCAPFSPRDECRDGRSRGRPLGLAAVMLVTVSVANGCGGSPDDSTPTGPTSGMGTAQICRTYVTAATSYLESGAVLRSTATATCSYDSTANQLMCTGSYVDAAGCEAPVTITTSYNSLADFIDEAQIVPPAMRWTQRSGTVGGSCADQPPLFGTGLFVPGDSTVFYDGQGRVTRIAASGGDTTYTAWDAAGRPTASSSGSITHDEASRTVVESPNSGTPASIISVFDTFGNMTARQVIAADGTAATTTTNLESAARVCR